MDKTEYREQLSRDLAAWRRDGIIQPEQEREILARVGAGDASVARALRLGWLVTAVSIIGALVLGGGVVLLFAANWQEMPDVVRGALVLAGMLGAYGVGYVLSERFGQERLGSAMYLLGAIIFQAGLFLFAQIYNMPVESPILFLLGALGGLPLAYLFKSRLVLLLSLIGIVAWQVWRAELAYDDGGAEEWVPLALTAAFGLTLYAIGRLHGVHRDYAKLGEVYVAGGALLVLPIVYCLTFVSAWDSVIDDGLESFSAPWSVYALLIVASLLILAQVPFRYRSNAELVDVGIQWGLLVLALVVVTWPAWTGYALVFNAVFFALAGALVVRGYLASDERYINAGLAAVGIGLISRYIDTFWSLLAGSAFFIVGGVLLLVLAFVVERVRQNLLDAIEDEEGDAGTVVGAEVVP